LKTHAQDSIIDSMSTESKNSIYDKTD